MKVVVDTNIVFSAILNTNSKIAKILLTNDTRMNFFSSSLLLTEIEEHKSELKKFTDYSDFELNNIISLITCKIKFIDIRLVPASVLDQAEYLTFDIDIDDTEFVALTNFIKGKLWSGDKKLRNGLEKKKWNKFISTDDLFERIIKR